jgi:hypothetical protein
MPGGRTRKHLVEPTGVIKRWIDEVNDSPKLKATTKKSYLNELKRALSIYPTWEDIVANQEDLLEKLSKKYADSSVRITLSRLIDIYDTYGLTDDISEIIVKYRELVDAYRDRSLKPATSIAKTDIRFDDIEQLFVAMDPLFNAPESELRDDFMSDRKTDSKKPHLKGAFPKMAATLAIKAYVETGSRASDLLGSKIIFEPSEIPEDDGNYLLFTGDTSKFIVNKSKTSKIYGRAEYDMDNQFTRWLGSLLPFLGDTFFKPYDTSKGTLLPWMAALFPGKEKLTFLKLRKLASREHIPQDFVEKYLEIARGIEERDLKPAITPYFRHPKRSDFPEELRATFDQLEEKARKLQHSLFTEITHYVRGRHLDPAPVLIVKNESDEDE